MEKPNILYELELAVSKNGKIDEIVRAIKSKKILEELCIASNILVKAKYLNEAEELNNIALIIDAECIPAIVTKGTIARLNQEFVLAKKSYFRAIEIDKNCSSAWYNLAVLAEIEQEPEKAIEYYKKVTKPHPNSELRIAICLQKLNQHAKAIVAFEQLLKIYPNNPSLLYSLAQSFQQEQQLLAANDALEKLLLIEPNNIDAQHSLATVHTERKQYELAINSFLQVLKINPKHHEALHNLASIYYFQKQYRKALDCWLKLLVIQPDEYTNYNIGSCYLALQFHDEARPYLESACHDRPSSTEPLINLASIFIKQEQWAKVLKLYKQALSIEPDNDEVKYVLSAIEQTGNNYLKAPPEYVKHLFDQYADSFEKHLLQNLKYCAHKIIKDNMLEHIKSAQKYNILDLGCGTGLCGKECKPYAKHLVGVDLSPQMLEQAKKTEVFDQLFEQDIEGFLMQAANFDIIVAADVLPYIGDLTQILDLARNALNHSGLFIFTVETTHRNQPYYLAESGRYQHNHELIAELVSKTNWTILESTSVVTRTQNFQAVTSRLFVLKKVV